MMGRVVERQREREGKRVGRGVWETEDGRERGWREGEVLIDRG